MVGRGALGNTVNHNGDRAHRNRDDRRQWRNLLYRSKRAAKSREKRAWRHDQDCYVIDYPA
jgi:hypothetical protein